MLLLRAVGLSVVALALVALAAAEGRAELEALTLKNLKAKARELGVDEGKIEELDDAADPKAAAVELVLGAGDEDARKEAELRAELEGLTLKALKEQAKELGVAEAKIEELDEADDAKAAAIDLVVAARSAAASGTRGPSCPVAAPSWAPLPAPERDCPAVRVTEVQVRAGEFIDHVSFRFSDGSSNSFGSETGGDALPPFALEEDEYVVAVEGRGGSFVDRLVFVTSAGRRSDAFGAGQGGEPFAFGLRDGGPVGGLLGAAPPPPPPPPPPEEEEHYRYGRHRYGYDHDASYASDQMYGSYGSSLLQPVSGVTSVDTALELLRPVADGGAGEGAGAGGPLPEGTYQGSCRDCVLDEEAQQLRCKCNDGSWGEVEASLDVSGCVDGGGIIENQNGQLNCVGPSAVGRCVHSLQRATEDRRCPL